MRYVELHCHTYYSLRDGASSPTELIGRAVELGYPALAATDHDGLYGAMEFARTATEYGIRPITGAEVTTTGGYHLTLLVETRHGYQNLCRLLSAAYQTFGKDDPEVTLDSLFNHAEGLIVLSGCRRGELSAWAQAGDLDEAERVARRFREWLGPDNFFVELQHNLVQGDRDRNATLSALARRLGLQTVATNDVHYHTRERHRLHDVLVAIRNRTTLDASHIQRKPNSEFYLKSAAEMAALFEDDAPIRSALRIADRCRFNLYRDLGYDFPHQPIPPGLSEIAYLEVLCREAFDRKYGGQVPAAQRNARDRLAEELRLIAKHRLAGFFLAYYDILKLAGRIAHELRGRDPNLPPDMYPIGRGRGSSVSSIVCYLIGLSHIDPVKNELFLGRFLNEELASVPDIDLDFPRDIRAALLEQIVDHFGDGRAALVCSFPTYRTRSAIREVGKVLGLPEPLLDKLAKHSDHWGKEGVAIEMSRLPELAGQAESPIWRDLVDLTDQIRGFPRHIGQHVGGIVLAAEPVGNLVPVEPARMEGRFVCQWDKDSVDDARMIKIDFLALGMLSAVDECLDTIADRRGERPDLGRIPHDDPAIYERICQGDTIGIFQIESRAQIQSLPRTRPRTIDDLAVQVAIVRPGPIVSGAFRPYMDYRRRLADGEPVAVHYTHPLLRGPLEETLGVILYQDQVLQVAMAVAGYTAGEADLLRRAMSRRRSYEALNDHWPRFLKGARARGVSDDAARSIFDSLLGFAAFGFPKSHAVAFALLAYESAWLRQYYPAEFYAALLNNQPMGFYSPEVLLGDARRQGIAVVRPDINASNALANVETDSRLRLGLRDIRGIGADAAGRIVQARADRPFRSLSDALRRCDLSREAFENLILAGAFDGFGLSRRELLWQLGLFIRGDLDQPALEIDPSKDMASLAAFSDWETVIADFNMMGLSPRAHPMSILRRSLPRAVVSSTQLARLPDGAPVQLAGMVVCRQRPGTAKGIVFLLLEDEVGLTNAIVSPQVYEAQRLLIRTSPFLTVSGRLQKEHGTLNIIARRFTPVAFPDDLLPPRARNFH
ncbi:MAG: error-prone DNA polymerase [Dehalococcoidia bacterium]